MMGEMQSGMKAGMSGMDEGMGGMKPVGSVDEALQAAGELLNQGGPVKVCITMDESGSISVGTMPSEPSEEAAETEKKAGFNSVFSQDM